jgi:hypothetical protein
LRLSASWLLPFDKEQEHVPFGERTAQMLMRIAEDERLSSTDHGRY